ncbi:cytochrome c biogenesis protein ResB [Actinoalloteichus hymeniacidonis]|uniref:Cytochrome c biogenesis membrane protein n=1 Tax=Actinoalloteichus hymeniacidonis TaxID=340345 RepID=A0AAC9HLI0_9PSEU|nr:cytochrome c biogenesis protein ResB [Actinoalloteichus hymeniacidonis]AOS61329.1 cytochrome c biogenesis membrane protein [Actinoalloteichus hymeniacidonis]MBB5910666.1 cytochrome c biogenesis protein [Actinoalloteichus hymeniacidonis]
MTTGRPSRLRSVLAFLRNTWRGLTTMRTALTLLFLLALASVPGALLPQESVNPALVDDFYADYPSIAPLLNALGMFDVFASVWFAAIYVLLFISLIGCLLPRTLEHAKTLRAAPVLVPRRLTRMPHHRVAVVTSDVEAVQAGVDERLRGWRRITRTESDGATTISAERGYLREVGNLAFHFALLGLLVSVAAGRLLGYEGQVIVKTDSEFCNSGIYAYDSFTPGITVDGTQLNPFCLQVHSFDAEYLHTGQAVAFESEISYQEGEDLADGTWRDYLLEVNHPLRLGTDRVYLLGNGYAPEFTVTFPDGQERVGNVQWRPVDLTTMLSEGATKFDPPDTFDEQERRENQIAVTGLLAPTPVLTEEGLLTSGFPDLNEPMVAVDVMRGDLGNNSGRGQSIFEIDAQMVEDGELERVARENLAVGEQIDLPDGTSVRFDGVQRWVSLQVSYDPAQFWVLVASVVILGGLGLSLGVKRRRLWVRLTPQTDGPDAGRTVVEFGGLARTDQAGYGEEFHQLTTELLDRLGDAGVPSPSTSQSGNAVSNTTSAGSEESDPPSSPTEAAQPPDDAKTSDTAVSDGMGAVAVPPEDEPDSARGKDT